MTLTDYDLKAAHNAVQAVLPTADTCVVGDPDPTWDHRRALAGRHEGGHPGVQCGALHPAGWCCTRSPHEAGQHVAGGGSVSWCREQRCVVGGVRAVWS